MGQQENLTVQLVEEMLELHYTGLYRVAYRYVRNEQDALDIVQESAYKAMKHCSSLREPRYAVTWLYRIVHNEAVSFLRKNKIDCVPLWEIDGEQEPRYADVDLHRAMAQLSLGEKTVVLLRFFEGLSFQQIAEMLQENINTVKSRLYRALQKLKAFLEEPYARTNERGVSL